MAPLIIASKFEMLRQLLERIAERVPADAAEPASDIDAQESVVLNLARAVQLCADVPAHLISRSDRPVPSTTRASFEILRDMGAISAKTADRLGKATGFRNIAIHRYDDMNWTLVHQVATRSLDDFRHFVLEIERWQRTAQD